MERKSPNEIAMSVRIAAALRRHRAAQHHLTGYCNASSPPSPTDDITDDEMNAIGMQALANGFYAQTFTTAEDVMRFLDSGGGDE